jgi:hypothetical protein
MVQTVNDVMHAMRVPATHSIESRESTTNNGGNMTSLGQHGDELYVNKLYFLFYSWKLLI